MKKKKKKVNRVYFTVFFFISHEWQISAAKKIVKTSKRTEVVLRVRKLNQEPLVNQNINGLVIDIRKGM